VVGSIDHFFLVLASFIHNSHVEKSAGEFSEREKRSVGGSVLLSNPLEGGQRLEGEEAPERAVDREVCGAVQPAD